MSNADRGSRSAGRPVVASANRGHAEACSSVLMANRSTAPAPPKRKNVPFQTARAGGSAYAVALVFARVEGRSNCHPPRESVKSMPRLYRQLSS